MHSTAQGGSTAGRVYLREHRCLVSLRPAVSTATLLGSPKLSAFAACGPLGEEGFDQDEQPAPDTTTWPPPAYCGKKPWPNSSSCLGPGRYQNGWLLPPWGKTARSVYEQQPWKQATHGRGAHRAGEGAPHTTAGQSPPAAINRRPLPHGPRGSAPPCEAPPLPAPPVAGRGGGGAVPSLRLTQRAGGGAEVRRRRRRKWLCVWGQDGECGLVVGLGRGAGRAGPGWAGARSPVCPALPFSLPRPLGSPGVAAVGRGALGSVLSHGGRAQLWRALVLAAGEGPHRGRGVRRPSPSPPLRGPVAVRHPHGSSGPGGCLGAGGDGAGRPSGPVMPVEGSLRWVAVVWPPKTGRALA